MKNILILLFCLLSITGYAQFSSSTTKKIDTIENNSANDITLKPNSSVKVNNFSGGFALQSGVAKELEESAVTNTELGFMSGVTSSVQDQLDSKTPLTRLINTTTPLQGGGDLSTDRTLSILQAGAAQDGFLTSADWNTFNGKQDAISGTDGDLYYWNSGLSNLGIGSNGQVLQVSALGFPEWADAPVSTTLDTKGQLQGFSTVNANVGPCTDDQILVYDSLEATGWKCSALPSTSPTTTEGDLIIRGASADERLPIGAADYLLTSNGTTASWQPAPVSLPDQTGNAGLYLTTNGSTASWNEVNRDVNEIKDNLLECAGFDACAYEGTITNGGVGTIDFSGATTRTLEAAAYNTSKLNLNQSAAETLDYTYTKTANFDGKQMVAYCEIKNNSGANGVTFSVGANGTEQGSLAVSTEAKWKYYKIPFVGGDTSQYFSINHSDTGIVPNIDVDNCFIGKASNITREIGSAHFVGSLTYDSPNCQWNNTSASYSDFPIDSDCVASNITGSIQSPDTAIPAIKIPNVRTDGYYDVRFNGLLYASTTTECRFSISSSSNYENQGDLWVKGVDTSNIHQNRATTSANGSFRFSDTGDKTLRIISYRVTGTGNCSVYGNSTNDLSAKFTVHFYPDDTSTIVTQDTELNAKTANVLSASLTNTGVVSTENFDFIDGNGSWNGTYYDIPLVSEFSNVTDTDWVCDVSNRSFADSFGTAFVGSPSAGNIRVYIRSTSSGYTQAAFKLDCHKITNYNKSATIVGKFEQIEEVNTVLDASTANELSARITDTGVVTSENYDWISSVSVSTSTFTVNFQPNIFTVPPSCVATAEWIGSVRLASIIEDNSTSFIRVYTVLNGSSASADSFSIHCSKQGADVKKEVKGVIVNASKSATKCQTKYLSANITSNGLVSDLQFSNLDTTKRYSLTTQVRCVAGAVNCRLTAYDGVVANNKAISTTQNQPDATGSEDRFTQTMVNPLFKPVSTTINYNVVANGSFILEGNTSISKDFYTWATLCELPDTYVETTKFD
jgi:hypothetical protein